MRSVPAFLILFLLRTCLLGQQIPSSGTPQNGGVPHLVKFSGILRNSTTNIALTFAIYDSNDSPSPLWTERQSVMPDETGHYSVLLGSATEIPDTLFSAGDARWLGIQVSGEPEQPRIALVSVPYALKAADAETLGGKPVSAFLLAPTKSKRLNESGRAQPETMAAVDNGGINGTVNTLTKWTSSTNIGNSLVFDDGTNVGIGTASPAVSFGSGMHVNSSSVGAFRLQGGSSLYEFLSIGSNGNFGLYDATHSAYRFYLTSAGNIGIGTTSPASTLDVQGNVTLSSSANKAGIAGFNLSGNGVIRTGINMTNLLGLDNSTLQGSFISMDTRSGQNAFSIFTHAAGSSTEVERVSVTGDGKVGIGNSTPAAALDVSGGLQVGGGGVIQKMIVAQGQYLVPNGVSVAAGACSQIGSVAVTGVSQGDLLLSHINLPWVISTPGDTFYYVADTNAVDIFFCNSTTASKSLSGLTVGVQALVLHY